MVVLFFPTLVVKVRESLPIFRSTTEDVKYNRHPDTHGVLVYLAEVVVGMKFLPKIKHERKSIGVTVNK